MTPETDWQARRDAEAGMAQALGHAESMDIGWGERAYDWLTTYCKGESGDKFTSYDFIHWYRVVDLPMPPTPKAFGSIFTKTTRNGLIRKVGYRPHPLRHASPTVLWEVL